MKHLTTEELVDVADGTRSALSHPHLQSCGACSARLADLRAMMAKVADVEVPEPSPLFWQHFSSRVSRAVAEAGAPGAPSWRDRLSAARDRFGAWRGSLGAARGPLEPAIGIALSLAAAAAIIVALIAVDVSRSTVSVPVPSVTESTAVPTEAVEGTAMIPPDDPALDIVADLGTGLDWDAVHDSGMVAHTGLVDRAVKGLSPEERAELGRLLKQELVGGGN